MEYSQEDNLLIQSYFTVAFLIELNSNDFLNSDYYKKMNFQDKFVKENLPLIGIDNQGALLIFLYTMLVLPKQLLGEKFADKFNDLNEKLDIIKSHVKSNYVKDKEKINYIRHIRNSVAHAKVEFIPNESVTFNDENNSGENSSITIPLRNIGELLTGLQKIFMTYIISLKQNRNK